MAESASNGINSRTANMSNPTAKTPAECPSPQRTPARHERLGSWTASGAMAAR